MIEPLDFEVDENNSIILDIRIIEHDNDFIPIVSLNLPEKEIDMNGHITSLRDSLKLLYNKFDRLLNYGTS